MRAAGRGAVWRGNPCFSPAPAKRDLISLSRGDRRANATNATAHFNAHTYAIRIPYAPYQLPAYHRYSTTWTSSTEHGPNRHHRNLTHNCTPASGISLLMALPYARSVHAKCLQLYTDQISCSASLTSHIVGSLRSFERVGICSDHHWSSTAVRVGESASTAKVVESTNFPCHCPTS